MATCGGDPRLAMSWTLQFHLLCVVGHMCWAEPGPRVAPSEPFADETDDGGRELAERHDRRHKDLHSDARGPLGKAIDTVGVLQDRERSQR
eukprot:15372143-Alexandrium_andersonii.AAC.1